MGFKRPIESVQFRFDNLGKPSIKKNGILRIKFIKRWQLQGAVDEEHVEVGAHGLGEDVPPHVECHLCLALKLLDILKLGTVEGHQELPEDRDQLFWNSKDIRRLEKPSWDIPGIWIASLYGFRIESPDSKPCFKFLLVVSCNNLFSMESSWADTLLFRRSWVRMESTWFSWPGARCGGNLRSTAAFHVASKTLRNNAIKWEELFFVIPNCHVLWGEGILLDVVEHYRREANASSCNCTKWKVRLWHLCNLDIKFLIAQAHLTSWCWHFSSVSKPSWLLVLSLLEFSEHGPWFWKYLLSEKLVGCKIWVITVAQSAKFPFVWGKWMRNRCLIWTTFVLFKALLAALTYSAMAQQRSIVSLDFECQPVQCSWIHTFGTGYKVKLDQKQLNVVCYILRRAGHSSHLERLHDRKGLNSFCYNRAKGSTISHRICYTTCVFDWTK